MRLSEEPADPSQGTPQTESDRQQVASKHPLDREGPSDPNASSHLEVTKVLKGPVALANDSDATLRVGRQQLNESVAVADIATIHKQISAGNLEQAALETRLALMASPGHAELLKLQSEIQEQIQKKQQFRRLVSEAEQYRRSRQWELAVERYQSARALNPDNKAARVHMARAYAGWAQEVLPADMKKAEKLMEISLGLDGEDAEVRQVQLAVLQEVTRELVDRAVINARELRSSRKQPGAELDVGKQERVQEVPTIQEDVPKQTAASSDAASLDRSRENVSPLLQGQILADRYEIVTHLGTGGMSSVYKARDLLVDETIALKIVLPFISREPRMREKFKQELLFARRLTHPNVIRIYDIGEHENLLFISMELIEGQTVADILLEQKRFTTEQFLVLLNQFRSALSYIHSQQVLHRDIKPQNLMYDKLGNLKLMDFGIARDMTSDDTTTVALGTPAYMSPELLEGSLLTPAADIYSAGTMFYELLTGAKPFTNASLHNRLTLKVPRVSDLVPDVPRDLDDLVFRCMQIRPEDRLQSADELVATVSETHRAPSTPLAGTLNDLMRDDPPSLLDVLPVFVKTVQQLTSIHADPSSRALLTPKAIQCTQSDVRIEAISVAEAQHTRAVDCKYISFEDFSDLTPGGARRLESDVYVVGFIFYEILLGQKLFQAQFSHLYKGDWNFQWLNWHSDATLIAPPLKQILGDIPAALSDTIEGMMQKAVERRPNLAAVEESFKSVLETLKRELLQTQVVRWKPHVPKKATPRKGIWIGAILMLVLLALAVGWFLRAG